MYDPRGGQLRYLIQFSDGGSGMRVLDERLDAVGRIRTITLWPRPENCVNTSQWPSGDQFERFTTALGCSIRVSRRSSLPSTLEMTVSDDLARAASLVR